MTRKRIVVMAGAVMAAAGLGAGIATAATGGPASSQQGRASTAVTAAHPDSYEQAMMSHHADVAGSMMGSHAYQCRFPVTPGKA